MRPAFGGAARVGARARISLPRGAALAAPPAGWLEEWQDADAAASRHMDAVLGELEAEGRVSGWAVAAGVLAAAMAAVLLTVAAVGALVLTYVAAARSVRAAADLTAVSAAQAHAAGADACAEANRVAGANTVEVGECVVTGDAIDFVVEVHVSRQVGVRLPGLPERVRTISYAGNVTGTP